MKESSPISEVKPDIRNTLNNGTEKRKTKVKNDFRSLGYWVETIGFGTFIGGIVESVENNIVIGLIISALGGLIQGAGKAMKDNKNAKQIET